MYHTRGFTRDELIDICVRIISVERDPDAAKWPPCLGLLNSVATTLAYLRHVPTADELDPETQYIVDGTLLPCWSWAGHKELYSGKHKTTGMSIQLACTIYGQLAWISDPVSGSRHDNYCLGESDVLRMLNPKNWIGDKGYIGNEMITPFRKPECRELLDWQKEFNAEVNKIRWMIEQVISHLPAAHLRPRAPAKSLMRSVVGCAAGGTELAEPPRSEQCVSAASVRMSALAAAGRCSGISCLSSVVLEAHSQAILSGSRKHTSAGPSASCRIFRWSGRSAMQAARRPAAPVRRPGRPEGDVVQADAVLAEPVPLRGTRQRRAPASILVPSASRSRSFAPVAGLGRESPWSTVSPSTLLVEPARPRIEVGDPQRDVVDAGEREAHAWQPYPLRRGVSDVSGASLDLPRALPGRKRQTPRGGRLCTTILKTAQASPVSAAMPVATSDPKMTAEDIALGYRADPRLRHPLLARPPARPRRRERLRHLARAAPAARPDRRRDLRRPRRHLPPAHRDNPGPGRHPRTARHRPAPEDLPAHPGRNRLTSGNTPPRYTPSIQ